MTTKLIRRFSYKRPASCIPQQKRIDLTTANKSWSYCCDPSKPMIDDQCAPKKLRISLIGANDKAGQMAAYILQQYPLVDRVYMFGSKDVLNTAIDLNNINRNCRVQAFYKEQDIGYSLKNTDIVMILDVDKKEDKVEKKFTVSAPRLAKIAENCRIHCPRAMVAVCVDPICCMVPLARHMLEGSPWFSPSKLLGSVTYIQTRINAIAARFLQLDPTFMQIPLVGGPDFESMVPAISLMVPNPNFSTRGEKKFYKYLKREATSVWDSFNAKRSPLNEGVAIANLAITIARGMCGYDDAWATGFTSIYMWNKERYMVSTIRFGEYGICYNNGVPNLSLFEMQQLVFALGKLRDRKRILSNILKPQQPLTNLPRLIC